MAQEYRDRYQTMVNKLKEGNHKLTPQRLAIIRILAGSEDHPTVEDIYSQLQRRFPGISQATVYRNIMLIKSLGEVLEIGFAGEAAATMAENPTPTLTLSASSVIKSLIRIWTVCVI